MKTEAIILRNIRWQDSSIITHALTDDYGRISIMTKGAFKRKENVMPYFDLFSITNFDLFKGTNMFYFNFADSAKVSEDLYKEPISFRVCSILSEIVIKTMLDNYSVPNIYPLTKKFLELLSKSKNKVLFFAGWLIKYISFMGYRPIISENNGELVMCEDGIVYPESGQILGHNRRVSFEESSLINKLLFSEMSEIIKFDVGSEMGMKILDLIIFYFKLSFSINRLNSYEELKNF
ncbi:DNA repair protein RecO [Ezakiella coagulans]|uniref:DNA repair protein RecO n=1 Tax=Ezakiella coagulans TaxID=46507 RepID=UPI00288A697E|nr:DNA repair protein RecO [Ezakiella coagulans]